MTRRVLPPTAGNSWLDERLAAAVMEEEASSRGRRCPRLGWREGLRYELDGRAVTSFCSNDYLGLADMRGPGAGDVPSGAAASRLVCGDLEAHRALEREFASFLGFEDAVLFPSGFQANASVPGALLGEQDVVHSDALNHASLIDGLRLARAKVEIVEHLRAPSARVGGRPAWWVVESVFSMDGDGPPGAELDTHLAQGGCLYLDEAHALGLYAGGRGRAGRLRHRPTVLVAPLGKAFGCAGAFVCGSAQVCAWLRGHARGFVFSTGVSPVLVERIGQALALVRGDEGERRRGRLWANVALARRLLGLGDAVATPIVPIVVGTNARALALSAALLERGWHVQAIRPPTVAEGAARLRITISAGHDEQTIARFVEDLRALLDGAQP